MSSRRELDRYLPSALLLAAFCLLCGSMWGGGFWWKDTWYAILTTSDQPLHPQLAAVVGDEFASFWSYAIERDARLGRFRPLYWAMVTAESALMRDRPPLWIVETHLIGVLACALLFVTARRLGLGLLPALFVPLWVMVAGKRLWAELQLSEEPALLFTALALYSLLRGASQRSRAWDGFGLASAACAGLLKESFVLTIPALLAYRVLLECRSSDPRPIRSAIWELRTWLALGGLVFMSLATVAAVFLIDPGGYDNRVVAGVSSAARWSPARWAEMLWAWSGLFAYFIPLLGLAWLAPALRSVPRVRRESFFGVLVVILWLGPQLLLYSATGFREHYFIPAIIPIAFACALGIDLLLRRRPRWLAWAIVVPCTAFLLSAAMEAANVVRRIAAASDAQAQWIERTAASAPERGRILLATSLVNHSRNMTFLTLLGENGVRAPVSLFVGRAESTSGNKFARQAARKCFPGSEPFDTRPRDLESIELIACMMSEGHFRGLAQDWYEPEEWSCLPIERSFTVRGFTVFPPKWDNDVRHIQYAILTRKP